MQASGLNVLRVIDSSTAASLACCLNNNFNSDDKEDENILIFDLGGGTFNISILTIFEQTIEVFAINCDLHLGGEYFDNRLVEYCLNEFKRQTSIDIRNNTKALIRVKTACEKAKKFYLILYKLQFISKL